MEVMKFNTESQNGAHRQGTLCREIELCFHTNRLTMFVFMNNDQFPLDHRLGGLMNHESESCSIVQESICY